jgi:imidazole glycerol-phosphate synthase subunit HisH
VSPVAPRIAIDYRMGNLRSVQKGFEHAGVAGVSCDRLRPRSPQRATASCCPGWARFAMPPTTCASPGSGTSCCERVAAGTPFLGICLGMQLLADVGLEDGEWEGLGIVPGRASGCPRA